MSTEVPCSRTLPQKNPEDPVWLEPSTAALRVEHFTTEPRRSPLYQMTKFQPSLIFKQLHMTAYNHNNLHFKFDFLKTENIAEKGEKCTLFPNFCPSYLLSARHSC